MKHYNHPGPVSHRIQVQQLFAKGLQKLLTRKGQFFPALRFRPLILSIKRILHSRRSPPTQIQEIRLTDEEM